jgi:acyl-CoA thioester hydrolase
MTISTEARITVRYAETDQMGIVYHANYLKWFNIARDKLMKEVGMGVREGEELGYYFPVRETSCEHFSPAEYDDQLIVRAETNPSTFAKLTVEYEVIKERNKRLLARGESLNVMTNEDGEILYRIPDEIEERLDL